MSTETIQSGTALVNDSGRSIIVKAANDKEVICNDSNFSREQKYELSNIREGVAQGHFRVVNESELTAIKGIGEATAPLIEAKTECTTPTELVEAYLFDAESGVRDAVRRTDYLNEWIQANIDSLNIDVSLAKIKVLLFLVEFGCGNNNKITNIHNTLKEDKRTIDHIQWEEGVWLGSATVAGVARSIEELVEFHNSNFWYEMKENKECEQDYHYQFTVDGGKTGISQDYIQRLQSIFTFNVEDVKCHPDGNFPVLVEDQDTGLLITIAPRIMNQ